MKHLFTAILAALVLTSTSLFADMDACMSGSFYDPDAPGSGINIEVLADQTIAYFYKDGGNWFLLQGNEDDGYDAYQPWSGGIYHVGWGAIGVVDANTIDFSYFLTLDIDLVALGAATPWCLHTGCEGDFVYQRLTQPIPCE